MTSETISRIVERFLPRVAEAEHAGREEDLIREFIDEAAADRARTVFLAIGEHVRGQDREAAIALAGTEFATAVAEGIVPYSSRGEAVRADIELLAMQSYARQFEMLGATVMKGGRA